MKVLIYNVMTELRTSLLEDKKYDYNCVNLVVLTIIVILAFIFIIYMVIHFS